MILRISIVCAVLVWAAGAASAQDNAQSPGKGHSYASSVSGSVGTSYASGRQNTTNYAPIGTGGTTNFAGGGYAGNNSYSRSSQGLPTGSYARTQSQLTREQQHVHLGRPTGGSLLGIMRGTGGAPSSRPQGLTGNLHINQANAVPVRATIPSGYAPPKVETKARPQAASSASKQQTVGKTNDAVAPADSQPAGPSLLQRIHHKRP